MFKISDYNSEIKAVARKCGCTPAMATKRFMADVMAGEAHDYNTAGALPEFDFAKAKKDWYAMSDAERKAEREGYNPFDVNWTEVE